MGFAPLARLEDMRADAGVEGRFVDLDKQAVEAVEMMVDEPS